jgi:hypothetical protein
MSKLVCQLVARLGDSDFDSPTPANKGCPIFRVLCERWEAMPHAVKGIDFDFGLAARGPYPLAFWAKNVD